MSKRECTCLECGGPLGPSKSPNGLPPTFCSTACRKAFNNRRATRGAAVYDLLMAGRYDRARNSDYISVMTTLARWWREEDKKLRAGRRSWNADPERDPLTEISGRIDARISRMKRA